MRKAWALMQPLLKMAIMVSTFCMLLGEREVEVCTAFCHRPGTKISAECLAIIWILALRCDL